MTFDSLLQPISLLFLVSFLFGISSPQFKDRRVMLGVKFIGDALCAIYLFWMGGVAGACAVFISGLGSLIQSLTPEEYLKKTIWARFFIAIVLTIISIYLVYQSALDLLPLTAIIISRFGELQTKPQNIRFTYLASCLPWIIYYFMEGLTLPLGAILILCVSLSIAIYRHHFDAKKNSGT